MPSDILDLLLVDCYKKDVMQKSDYSEIVDRIKRRIASSEIVKQAAQDRLAELSDDVTQRCFVSRKTREYLTKALQGD